MTRAAVAIAFAAVFGFGTKIGSGRGRRGGGRRNSRLMTTGGATTAKGIEFLQDKQNGNFIHQRDF